jgi:hypothetical protein
MVGKSRRDWSKIPLGEKPDSVISRELGIPIGTIGGARRRLGIPRYAGTNWDEIPLGQMSDREIANKHNLTVAAVGAARRKRGIPLFERGEHDSERFDWASLPLGQKSDADIAAEHGLKASSVGSARRRRGIRAYVEPGKELPARAKRGIDWDDQPLGQMPDRLLQRKLGLKSSSSVTRARLYRGIKKFEYPSYAQLKKLYQEFLVRGFTPEGFLGQWDDRAAIAKRFVELNGEEDPS